MAEQTIREAIEQTAKGPSSATSDGHGAVAQNIQDQIAADRYLSGQETSTTQRMGIRVFKIKGNAFES
jgi:hypothetical protein